MSKATPKVGAVLEDEKVHKAGKRDMNESVQHHNASAAPQCQCSTMPVQQHNAHAQHTWWGDIVTQLVPACM